MVDNRSEKLMASLVAVVATEAFSSCYDDLLYPIAIATFGPLYGGVGVSIAAILINFMMVMWYRRTETDWYSFEAAREAEALEVVGHSSVRVSKSKWMSFVALSVQDPFLAFAYMEGRKKSVAFDVRDWVIFALANAIGIGSWLIVLLVVFAAGGYISESAASWFMYIFAGYGLFRILKGTFAHRVAAR